MITEKMKIDLLTIKEASQWASDYLKKNITTSNISYLIQYGKVKKYQKNGRTTINKNDLINYYQSYHYQRKNDWHEQLGEDLNWALSFDFFMKENSFLDNNCGSRPQWLIASQAMTHPTLLLFCHSELDSESQK